jgi:hypothetical protein
MNPVRKYFKNKKGINTILAALLMVVIVVVASVMVYAWSTGLLGALMGGTNQNVGKEALNLDNFAFASSGTNVTLYLRNSGTAAITLQSYYVKDNSGNSWQLSTFTAGPINPNAVLAVNIAIGSSAGGCGSACQYTGTPSAFNTFVAGNSYTVQVVTSRNTPFPFTVTR